MASFAKYSGPWTLAEATHLLRRTTYGCSPTLINQATTYGLDALIDKLFEAQPLPPHPINVSVTDEPAVPIGDTWHDKLIPNNQQRFNTSLRAWTMERFLENKFNITEKMTVFWHNHFVTADINDPRLTYQYISLLRQNALGNFKQLTKDITIDVAMLNYLNGRENTKQAPNENYARELLELFTIGKGELVAPGDYTTYTEADIKEAAKVLTGWVDVRNQIPIRSEFRIARHDITIKTLSHRFNNITISNGNENEYKTLIDIIFERQEVATFISRKLYIWFVNPIITSEIEEDIIKPMASMLRNDGYNVKGTLKALLSSEHFFDNCVRGTIIKNPLDFIGNIFNHFGIIIDASNPVNRETAINRLLYFNSGSLQMAMYQAPSVSGWTPYYQAPSYDAIWLNSTTIPIRRNNTDALVGNGITNSDIRLRIDHIKYLDSLSQPNDPDVVMNEVVSYLFPNPLAQNQIETIRTIFLNGYTKTAWSTAYTAYKADPTNEAKRLPLVQRMTNLLRYLMRMPEYQLS